MRRPALLLVPALVLLLGACVGGGTPAAGPVHNPRALPTATGAAAPPASGPLGLKWSWFQPDTFDFVRRSAGGWTFHEVEWCEIEASPGQRDWTGLDRIVLQAIDLGHEPMLKLRTGQCWGTQPATTGGTDPTEATAKTASMPPLDLAAYLAFVTELTQRYAAHGVHEYAIENEVDVANFWAADLASYEALVRQVAPAIRAADPEARVLEAGPSSTSYGVVLAAAQLAAGDEATALATYQAHYGRRVAGNASRWPAVGTVTELRAVLDGPSARRSVEAVDLAIRLAVDGIVDVYQLHFYESAQALPDVLAFLDERLAGSAPVEAWEVGVAWPGAGYDEAAHAEELLRLVAVLLAHDVRRIVYLPVAYTPGHRAQVFRGLIHADGALLAAGRAWVALVDALAGLGESALRPVSGGLTGVAWTAAGRDAAIVWATDEPVTLPPGDDRRVLDAAGLEVPPDAPVGRAPVLVLGSQGEDPAFGFEDGR